MLMPMLENDILQIVMRYLHVVSAVVAVGGTAFALLCLSPAVQQLEEAARRPLVEFAEGRFRRVLALALLGLLVTGIFNWAATGATYKAMGPMANALLGTKVLLAFVLFGIVIARASNLLPGPSRRWHIVNVHLAAIIILLAAVLRHYRLEHLHLAGG